MMKEGLSRWERKKRQCEHGLLRSESMQLNPGAASSSSPFGPCGAEGQPQKMGVGPPSSPMQELFYGRGHSLSFQGHQAVLHASPSTQ